MTEVAFTTKVDIIIGGRTCPPSLRAPLAEGALPEPGKITGFFLAAWMGAGSREFSLSPIAADGTATVRLRLQGEGARRAGGNSRDKPAQADVDTVKLAVSFNIATPKGSRNCALASSFIPVGRLLDLLAAGGTKADFGSGEGCLRMRDNFTKNAALLRFRNLSTNLPAARALRLRPSSLHQLDRTGAAVIAMGNTVREAVAGFAVSPLNAGPQFMEAFTYWHMERGLTNYAILGHLMSTLSTPVDLHWVMYDAYQTVHTTGLSLDALARLDDSELVVRFGLPLISAHVGCALSSIYNTDYTASLTGQVVKLRETEDIARTFSRVALDTQGLAAARPFVSSLTGDKCGMASALPGGGAVPPVGRCIAELQAAQEALRGPAGLSQRISFPVVADDCENCAEGCSQKGKGLLVNVYQPLLPPGAPADPQGLRALDASLAAALAERMRQAAAKSHLFAALGPQDHAGMAGALVRLGRLLHTQEWANHFTVCSAKGAAFTEVTPETCASLAGHGTLLASVRGADGVRIYVPVEGTSYFRADPPPPPGYAQELTLHCEDGSQMSVPFHNALTLTAQTVHQILGISPDCGILAHLSTNYKDPSQSPFYVAAFFMAALDANGSLGWIPLDTCPPETFKAGMRPLFGAPLMGLSPSSTMAMQVGRELLGETPEQQAEVHALLVDQVSEMYSPPTDRVDVLSSFWQPCAPPDALPPPLAGDAPFGQAECTWAFDNPDHTTMAVAVCRELAARFNALQAQDPANDGVVASAFGKYLSAAFILRVRVPKQGAPQPKMSSIRNLRLAATQVGINQLAACPMKNTEIRARASVPSEHPFYMCAEGNGPVHAHNVRLA